MTLKNIIAVISSASLILLIIYIVVGLNNAKYEVVKNLCETKSLVIQFFMPKEMKDYDAVFCF